MQTLIESSILDTVFLRRTPSSSANPSSTINVTGSSVNAQHNLNPDRDLYRHRWFSMIILLIYCLSLAVAADLIFMFPYLGTVITTVNLETYQSTLGTVLTTDQKPLLIHYAVWFSLNIVLIGAFTFFVISVPDGDSRLRLHWIGHQVQFLITSVVGRNSPDGAARRLEKAWIATLTWYILIAGIFAGSCAYDVMWISNYLGIDYTYNFS